MNFELVEIPSLSGDCCQIFSILIEGEEQTLFENFAEEYEEEYVDEIADMYNSLKFMGNEGGARLQFFKDKEGSPGDGVSALYDHPDQMLRLYCIVYGRVAVILGGGGPKPKSIRAWQDDPKLCREATMMIYISSKITQAIKDGDIKITDAGLSGELKIIDDYGD